MSNKYVLAGRLHGKLAFVESKPERCALHGTMGDYGYTPDPARALLFDRKSTADWHAARVFGLDGHRASVVMYGPHETAVGSKNERNHE